jgi:anti-sigma-K factor RskA
MVDTDQDALAAEYVLGTLSADEREDAEALLRLDPGFARAVRQWERRLGELNVMVEAVEPAPEVWEKIKSQITVVPEPQEPRQPLIQAPQEPPKIAGDEIEDEETEGAVPPPLPLASNIAAPLGDDDDFGVSESVTASLAQSLGVPPVERPEPRPRTMPASEPKPVRGADIIYLSRRVRRWRRTSLLFGTIAALLALYVAGTQFAPQFMPQILRSPGEIAASPSSPAARPPTQLAGVLQQDPTAPAFLMTVDTQSRTLTVRRISATPENSRSYELWLISSRFPSPRSLGVVGQDEFTQRPLPSNYDLATVRGASYAVSLEPTGGSPSGVPTGPILFTGKLVDSQPAPTPAPATPKT